MTITEYIVTRITIYRTIAMVVSGIGFGILWSYAGGIIATGVLLLVLGEAAEKICREALEVVRQCNREVEEDLDEE